MTFRKPSIAAILLALVPFAGMLFTVGLWDRVDPTVLGLPFNFAWLLGWLVLCPLCLGGAYQIERKRPADSGETP